MNPNIMEIYERAEEEKLRAAFPLSRLTDYARYVDGMRETVQYHINIDGYLIRHDWLKNGERIHVMGEPIHHAEAQEKGLAQCITQRRYVAQVARWKGAA